MGEENSVWSRPLARFRADTAANRPTPGCGAVAAVSADLGLALVLKGLRISEARQPDERRRPLLEAAETLLTRLGAFADEDMQAFRKLLHAARRAAPTPVQDAQRQQALEAATRQACAVPLATAHACLEALGLAEQAWPLTDAVVQSDVEAGGLLVHAGLTAVLLNVDADLAGLDDAPARQQALQARERLQAEGDRRLRALRARASAPG